jgi:hypothetical protein
MIAHITVLDLLDSLEIGTVKRTQPLIPLKSIDFGRKTKGNSNEEMVRMNVK